MARAQLTNNAVTTLSAAAGATDTTLYLASGGGGKFPSSGYFYATLLDSANVPEIVKVTSRAVDQLTVVRAQDGTSARSFASGASVRLNLVAAVINELVPSDGTGATGTWGINISGNAATATKANTADTQAQGDSSTKIATTEFVSQNSIPTGGLVMWPLATAPTGFLLANGAAVSRTVYAALFAAIGTTFGAGDGSTTFNLPNYTNRMPIGAGGLYSVGGTGGSKDAVVVSHTHTATVNDPGHAHTYNYYPPYNSSNTSPMFANSNVSTTANTTTNTTGITVTNSTVGESGTDKNLPPYLSINFIIKT